MALNNVILMGRLTADPELKKTANDNSVCGFCIAVDKPYNKENEHPEANFIDVVAWNNRAENICKFFSKGSRIILEGSLQTRNYEDKEGKKRKAVEVLLDSFNFVDKKSDNDESGTETKSNSSSKKAENPVDDSDDVPW